MGEIRKGQKVKLFVQNLDKEFDCFIKEVYDDRISLDYPQDIIEYSDYFEEGEDIPVKIFTPLGVKSFSAAILDAPYEENFTIEYVESTNDLQRREYVRVPFSVKVFVETQDKKNIIAYTLDISGGGLKFFSEEEIESQEVKITIYMPDDRSLHAKGTIIHNQFIPVNEHVLSFTEIDEKDRDRIIKKCFELQLARE